MYPEVPAVPASPGPSGLWASAIKPKDGARWEQGFAWRPERCFNMQGYDQCDELADPPPPNDSDIAYYTPPAYRVRDLCSTIGGVLDIDRVRRQVEAGTSAAMANELWTGAISVANPATINGAPYVNAHLASTAATTVVTTGTIAERLAKLEQAALDASNGQQVVLHVPVHMVTPIANLLHSVGPSLFTALNSLVIADGAYPGTGPDGTGTTWAYATGPVQARVSTIDLIEAPVETIDRSTNRQEVWGSSVFAATFDPCLHLATNVGA
jgi:hypothetical protein